MIPFNRPPYIGVEEKYINQAIANHKISGDGVFTKKCSEWLRFFFEETPATLLEKRRRKKWINEREHGASR